AKSLFQKGADFVSAMVFMFASTNLVVELGVVLVVLMGWQFAVAEFVGGPIMIVLLALTGGFVLRGALVGQARRRLQAGIVGGHTSSIFADLIALPLVLIYRKYYGNLLTVRLFVWFYVVMAAAGLIVEGLFSVTGGIPSSRPGEIVTTHFAWNYTTFLNIAGLGAFAVLYFLYRSRERLGGGHGYAIDPVCGMQVQTANAPARTAHDGHTY